MRLLRSLALVSMLCFCGASVSHAQNPLLSARQRLATYDLRGSATTDVIRDLGPFLRGTAGEAEKREARFLRALAASDLVILARVRNDDALVDRVATALGVPRADVITHLDAELRQLVVGYYAEAATEARVLLRLTNAAPSDLREAHGVRRDYIYLSSVVRSLEGAADASSVLESLGDEPCVGSCTGVMAALDPASRKVFSSIRELRRIVRDLSRARREGDPFAAALTDVETLSGRITALPLNLRYVAPDGFALPLAGAASTAATASPDTVVFITAQEIRIAFLPRILLAADGSAALDSRNPTYPGGTTIRLPTSFPQTVGSIEPLVASLRTRFAGAHVALAGAQTTEAHLVARIALTLRAAGADIVAVAARTEDGALAFFPAALGTANSDASVVANVRPGGYDIHVGRERFEIERVHDTSGFRPDVEGLARRLHGRRFETAEIRAARTVGFGGVVSAFAEIRSGRPPTLVLLP